MSEVVRFASPSTVWLPAFCCQSMLAAASSGSVHFYPLETDLSPAVDFLEARVEQGDVVICVDYFGALPSPEFRAFVKTRPDVWWIEDRAQALMPETIGETGLFIVRANCWVSLTAAWLFALTLAKKSQFLWVESAITRLY